MPGQQQYYLNPFESRADKGIGDTEEKYASKKNCKVVTPDDLPFIEYYSTLLIDGHGAAGNEAIATDLDPLGKSHEELSAVNLAMLLHGPPGKQPLLPRDHVRIRLLGCHTADSGGSGKCMASALARWLGIFGYKKIAVAGYRYATWSFTKGERTRVSVPDEVRLKLGRTETEIENFTDSGFVVWYGSEGEVISKPRFDIYDPMIPNQYVPGNK